MNLGGEFIFSARSCTDWLVVSVTDAFVTLWKHQSFSPSIPDELLAQFPSSYLLRFAQLNRAHPNGLSPTSTLVFGSVLASNVSYKMEFRLCRWNCLQFVRQWCVTIIDENDFRLIFILWQYFCSIEQSIVRMLSCTYGTFCYLFNEFDEFEFL